MTTYWISALNRTDKKTKHKLGRVVNADSADAAIQLWDENTDGLWGVMSLDDSTQQWSIGNWDIIATEEDNDDD